MNSPLKYGFDKEVLDYYGKDLKQVFLYITSKCNLRCKQCIYKPRVVYQMGKGYFDLDVALNLLSDFHVLGAKKLSILGGEPTLYDEEHENKALFKLIKQAREIGYKTIRMDTNGQFPRTFLDSDGLNDLDEISFSLDGHTAAIHDHLRGDGSFENCVGNIKAAVKLGYPTKITACVHRLLVEQDENGNYELHNMIKFAESMKVKEINFHILFKHGFPMDTWSEQTDVQVLDWIKVFKQIHTKNKEGEYQIKLRLPRHFVTREEFEKNKTYYGYCPVKLRERVLIHPTGVLQVCSGLLASGYCLARFTGGRVVWERSQMNETLDHDFDHMTPCTNQSKTMDCKDYLPLCFSFKEEQEEPVWKDELKWGTRKSPIKEDLHP